MSILRNIVCSTGSVLDIFYFRIIFYIFVGIAILLSEGCSGCNTDYEEELNTLWDGESTFVTYDNVRAAWLAPDFPLNIYVPDTVSEDFKFQLDKSMGRINQETKCQVFGSIIVLDKDDVKFGGLLKHKDITLRVLPERLDRNGDTLITYVKKSPGRIFSAEIQVYERNYSSESLEKVLIHELLHSVGLDHDRFMNSIMYADAASSFGIIERVDALYVRDQCRTFIP